MSLPAQLRQKNQQAFPSDAIISRARQPAQTTRTFLNRSASASLAKLYSVSPGMMEYSGIKKLWAGSQIRVERKAKASLYCSCARPSRGMAKPLHLAHTERVPSAEFFGSGS